MTTPDELRAQAAELEAKAAEIETPLSKADVHPTTSTEGA